MRDKTNSVIKANHHYERNVRIFTIIDLLSKYLQLFQLAKALIIKFTRQKCKRSLIHVSFLRNFDEMMRYSFQI